MKYLTIILCISVIALLGFVNVESSNDSNLSKYASNPFSKCSKSTLLLSGLSIADKYKSSIPYCYESKSLGTLPISPCSFFVEVQGFDSNSLTVNYYTAGYCTFYGIDDNGSSARCSSFGTGPGSITARLRYRYYVTLGGMVKVYIKSEAETYNVPAANCC